MTGCVGIAASNSDSGWQAARRRQVSCRRPVRHKQSSVSATFNVDPRSGELRKRGIRIKLRIQPFQSEDIGQSRFNVVRTRNNLGDSSGESLVKPFRDNFGTTERAEISLSFRVSDTRQSICCSTSTCFASRESQTLNGFACVAYAETDARISTSICTEVIPKSLN